MRKYGAALNRQISRLARPKTEDELGRRAFR